MTNVATLQLEELKKELDEYKELSANRLQELDKLNEEKAQALNEIDKLRMDVRMVCCNCCQNLTIDLLFRCATFPNPSSSKRLNTKFCNLNSPFSTMNRCRSTQCWMRRELN